MQLSNIIRQIKEAVAHRVSHRLKVTEAVQIATLLDPSTKDLMCSVPFDEQKKNCWLAIQNFVLAITCPCLHRVFQSRPCSQRVG